MFAAGAQLTREVIDSVLIVVPTTPLIEQWREEFKKWGYDDSRVDIACTKSAYKYDAYYDLLIVDEVHLACSPEYRALFRNVKYSQLLCLTATVPHNEEYLEFLEKVAPIVYNSSLNDALEAGAINEFSIINVEVPMNKKDRSKYQRFDTLLRRAQAGIGDLKKHDDDLRDSAIFDIAKRYKEGNSVLAKLCRQFWSAMTMRKWTCYEAESKIPIVIKILRKYPEKKWIIFNKSIKFAELLHDSLKTAGFTSLVYHSKMKTGERQIVLDVFKERKAVILIAVDALNAGLNVPDADGAISVSGVSTEIEQVQRLGRINRLQENKIALFFNLFCANTIEESWVRKKTEKLTNVRFTKI